MQNQPPNNGYPPQGQMPYGGPPGQMPPPQYGYGGPPPKKKGLPTWAWILIGLPIVAIVACVVLFTTVFSSALGSKTEADKVVDQFLRAAAVSDVDQMVSLVDSSYISRDALETDFLATTAGYMRNYSKLNLNGFNSSTVNGNEKIEVNGTANYGSKSGVFTSTLAKSGATWRIIGINVKPPN